ncbi:MAG: glycosyltransferase family 2 protein [Thomasclavelia sp.]|uniref:glycosyltransferase family 2 protein n=1 Tax=Thomasclavelia sp. TaxID=3025757 RepID=UPI00399F7089
MNKQELISVIIAVYNMQKFLERCVESVLSQTYYNLEILLVNDGSKDASLKLCRQFEKRDSRVKVINKENGGLTTARKAGFEASRGKYITFIDSDDYLEEDYIAKQYQNIITSGAEVSICCYFLEKDGITNSIELHHDKNIYEQNEFIHKLLLPGVYPVLNDTTTIPNFLWLRLFDRTVISEDCFVSEREVYTEDLFFNAETYKYCKKISILDCCLYHYCVNSSSLTHIFRKNRYKMEKNRIDKIKEFLVKVDALDNERIYLANIRMIWECIDNAMRLDSFNAFKNEVKPIFENCELHSLPLNKVLKFVSKGEKVCYFCFKNRWYLGAYCFKKIIYYREKKLRCYYV